MNSETIKDAERYQWLVKNRHVKIDWYKDKCRLTTNVCILSSKWHDSLSDAIDEQNELEK